MNSLGTPGVVEPEEILDLRRGDQHGDAVGETDGDGAGDELDRRAQPGQAHHDQHHAGHDGHIYRPDRPNLATMPATMTTNAPVGPAIWYAIRPAPRR